MHYKEVKAHRKRPSGDQQTLSKLSQHEPVKHPSYLDDFDERAQPMDGGRVGTAVSSVHDFDSDRPQTKKRNTSTKDRSVGRRSQVVNTSLKSKSGGLQKLQIRSQLYQTVKTSANIMESNNELNSIYFTKNSQVNYSGHNVGTKGQTSKSQDKNQKEPSSAHRKVPKLVMIRPKSGNTTPQKNKSGLSTIQLSKPKINNFLKGQNNDLKYPPNRVQRSSNSMGLSRPSQAQSTASLKMHQSQSQSKLGDRVTLKMDDENARRSEYQTLKVKPGSMPRNGLQPQVYSQPTKDLRSTGVDGNQPKPSSNNRGSASLSPRNSQRLSLQGRTTGALEIKEVKMMEDNIQQLNQTNYQMRQNVSKIGIIVNQLASSFGQLNLPMAESPHPNQINQCIDAINTLLNDVHYQVLKNDDGLAQLTSNW